MVRDTQLYDILGVSPDSDERAIKKAFMLKAKELHPDKNRDDPQATEKFQRLNEAYEVLKDEEKRRRYDQGGLDALRNSVDDFDIFSSFFRNPFGRNAKRGQERTPDVTFEISVTLEDLYSGVQKKIKINRTVICDACKGVGCKEGKSPINCPECDGTGQKVQIMRMGPMIQQAVGPCPACRGLGETIKNEDKCKKCNGAKTVKQDKTQPVEIPPGSAHGDKIKYHGMADEKPKAIAGDLVIILKEKPHSTFRRNGEDLLVNKDLSLSQALLGCTFEITHLDKRRLIVKTSPGEIIRPGDFKVIEREGMPKKDESFSKGKLYVHFNIKFPAYSELSPDFKNVLGECIPVPAVNYDPNDENIHEVKMSNASKEDFERKRTRRQDDDDDDDPRQAGVQCQGQ